MMYFWIDGEVAETETETDYLYNSNEARFNNYFCVDTSYPPDDIEMRYGMFIKGSGWVHFDLSKFPAQFRAWMLINL